MNCPPMRDYAITVGLDVPRIEHANVAGIPALVADELHYKAERERWLPKLRGKKSMFTTRRAIVALSSAAIATRVTGLGLAPAAAIPCLSGPAR